MIHQRLRVRALLAIVGAAALVATGCGGGSSGGGGDAPKRTITGKITYDFVPAIFDPGTNVGRLAFDQTQVRPARAITVRAVSGSTVLGETQANDQGDYTLTFAASATNVQIVAIARTAPPGASTQGTPVPASTPVIEVRDNTSGGALWAAGVTLDPSSTRLDLHAPSGWTGSSYDPSRRIAAPFAILDSMYTASLAFQAARPAARFPTLKVYWSPNNVPGGSNPAAGQIGTSHYSPNDNAIYILGKDGVDTDEFDSHVIVHEWAHFFEANLSRSDSPGGPHGAGDILDPRLSFGEGYGDAIPSMVLPETMYVDTYWQSTTLTAFGFDAADPSPTDDPNPGPFSEMSVMRALYHLFDAGTGQSWDAVALGLGPIYDVLTGPEKTTPALTTIGSFVAGVKAQPGVNGSAVDAVLGHYGIGPITTEWGDGDASLRDMYANVPTLTATPATGSVTFVGGAEYNTWFQNQYYVVTGTGRNVMVSAQSVGDVGLEAFQNGRVVKQADQFGNNATETMTFPTTANATYVVSLVGFYQAAGNYTVNISFSSP